jgi:hypothetical protein
MQARGTRGGFYFVDLRPGEARPEQEGFKCFSELAPPAIHAIRISVVPQGEKSVVVDVKAQMPHDLPNISPPERSVVDDARRVEGQRSSVLERVAWLSNQLVYRKLAVFL